MSAAGAPPANRVRVAPTASYRLQFGSGVDLAAACDLVPYLARLGVSHLYSSPLLQARAGSTHGYDVVDPTRLNRELGSDASRVHLTTALRARGMGLVLDIVPNHMGIGRENAAWEDLLTHGRSALSAAWFDIEWDAPVRWPHGGVLLPVLGAPREACLASGELALRWVDDGFRVVYGTQSFPVEPASIAAILPSDDAASPALAALQRRFAALPPWTTRDLQRAARRRSEAAAALTELATAAANDPVVRRALDDAVARFGEASRLEALLERQPYRLVHWRRAATDLNYRRFFEVSDLVGLRVEDPAVFAAIHATVFGWVLDGGIDALRIDHVDGLVDPLGYLRTLASHLERLVDDGAPALYVEKILAGGERLRDEWPVAGTTGYDFLALVDALFVAPEGFAAIEQAFRRRIAPRPLDFATVAYEAKRRTLRSALGAETRRLARELCRLLRRRHPGLLVDAEALRAAIVETLAACPVYRTYADDRYPVLAPEDRRILEASLADARRRGRAAAAELDLLAGVLLPPDDAALDEADRAAARRFVQRFQQVGGPAMAKGVEDTAFYTWAPLAACNEVGASPGTPHGDALDAFHAANAERACRHPAAMLCTTTHDTKRSADLRSRLQVLSEIPEVWIDAVARWHRSNTVHRTRGPRRWWPDPSTEYAFYQAAIGLFPCAEAEEDAATLDAVRPRLQAYMTKAVREAKEHTSWTEPDAAFEAAVARFVDATLDDAAFVADLSKLAARVARPGLWNALARTLLHLTAPGVPDLYQGDELWRFALVDPDSRRPVDFARRAAMLDVVEQARSAPAARRGERMREMVARVEEGSLKLLVIRTALAVRQAYPTCFVGGGYRALATRGQHAGRVVAFARDDGDGRAIVVVVPRFTAALAGTPVGGAVWGDTAVAWPGGAVTGEEQMSGARVRATVDADGAAWVAIADVCAECPVGLVVVDRAE